MRILFSAAAVVFLGAGTTALLAQKKAAVKAAAPVKSAYDKAAMEAYVRHLFLWGPQIVVTVDDPKPSPLSGFQIVTVTGSFNGASQSENFHVSKDGQQILRGAVYNIATNPFKSEIDKLKTEMQPSFGAPGASVVVAVFSDFQCGYCRTEAKVLRDNVTKAYPEAVRVYFKDFPIDQIHPWARPASIAGRCVFRQQATAFWDYHDWVFDKQPEFTVENLSGKVMEWAKGKNLDTLMLGQCMESKATEPEIEKSLAEGKSLRVDSTPTVFVNGRKLPGSVQWPQLKQVIDFEIDYQKKTADAGEKCCELTLPTPFKN